jgi:hypothetical protein
MKNLDYVVLLAVAAFLGYSLASLHGIFAVGYLVAFMSVAIYFYKRLAK